MNCCLHTREQVESALQTECISIVPLVASKDSKLSRSAKPMLSSDQDLATVSMEGSFLVIRTPFGPYSIRRSPALQRRYVPSSWRSIKTVVLRVRIGM